MSLVGEIDIPIFLTLNQHFKEQGYQTIGMGKIYHGSSGAGVDPTHWNRWIKLHANGHYLKKENLEILEKALAEAKVGDQHDPPKGPMTESADVSDDAYIDGMRAQKTVELLEELSKGSDQPFFLQLECLNHIYRSLPQKNIGICMTVMTLKCRQMQGFSGISNSCG